MTPSYTLLYRTVLCNKIARAPEVHKNFVLTKLGGDRIDLKNVSKEKRKRHLSNNLPFIGSENTDLQNKLSSLMHENIFKKIDIYLTQNKLSSLMRLLI